MSRGNPAALGPHSFDLKPQNMGALDIETKGFMDGFILGRVRHWDGRSGNFTSLEDMLEFILDTPKQRRRHTSGWIWAHNGGGFDFAYLAEPIRQFVDRTEGVSVRLIPQGKNKFIGAEFTISTTQRGYKVLLIDSMAVCPSSLEKMAASFAPHMPKLGHCEDHDFANGGDWFSPECDTCLRYLARDVDALLESMKGLEKLLHEKFQAPLSVTNGAIAIKAAKTTLDKVYFRMRPEYEEFVRPAVHGGFTWPGHKRGSCGPALTFDRSAAYGYQLKQGLPYGKECFAGEFYDNTVPGIWDCTVFVPHEISIPVLCGPPGGPAYPTGRFRHKFTNLELDYAEKLGCVIEQVHQGLVWEGYVYPFDEFIDRCEALEYPDGVETEDKAVKGMVKLLRNALPGKFATKPTVDKYTLTGDTPEEDYVPVLGKDGMMTGVFVQEDAEIEGAGYIFPHWNAFITARQRIDIHQILVAAGEYAYYSDTDSITLDPVIADLLIKDGTIDHGKGYGKYHAEGEWDNFIVGGPKNKMGERQGKFTQYAKGIPAKCRTPELGMASAEGVAVTEVSWESPTSFKVALLHPGSPHGMVRHRKYSKLENSSSWQVDDNNQIRPRAA